MEGVRIRIRPIYKVCLRSNAKDVIKSNIRHLSKFFIFKFVYPSIFDLIMVFTFHYTV